VSWKGGIGTSSRRLTANLGGYTVGVLVQTNFGGVLTIAGAPGGQELDQYYLRKELQQAGIGKDKADGSCMIVVATDAPLDARNLKRLAARAWLGVARTGSALVFDAEGAQHRRANVAPVQTNAIGALIEGEKHGDVTEFEFLAPACKAWSNEESTTWREVAEIWTLEQGAC
jgi:hypothetical protein